MKVPRFVPQVAALLILVVLVAAVAAALGGGPGKVAAAGVRPLAAAPDPAAAVRAAPGDPTVPAADTVVFPQEPADRTMPATF